ncbi:hypothetical protein TL16_g04160 [Triparma laevis f. inornata]|uniref:RNA helicase n=2 Tax=Triparma laevis TaxID=1534972 RepID=A0A9W7C9R1_9STRA|nr:hypothetical protein TL16_g04160 [Triparma laevis f. inornata]GMI01828.1 hypothetical protein TrLO_g3147 [Triparma laevis f. longispina]
MNAWGSIFISDKLPNHHAPITAYYNPTSTSSSAVPTSLKLQSISTSILHAPALISIYYPPQIPKTPTSNPSILPTFLTLKLHIETSHPTPTLNIHPPPINDYFSYTVSIKTDLEIPLTIQLKELNESVIKAGKYVTVKQKESWGRMCDAVVMGSLPGYALECIGGSMFLEVFGGGGPKSWIKEFWKEMGGRRENWRVFSMWYGKKEFELGKEIEGEVEEEISIEEEQTLPYKVLAEKINQNKCEWKDVVEYTKQLINLLKNEEKTVSKNLDNFSIYEMKQEPQPEINNPEINAPENIQKARKLRIVTPDLTPYDKCSVCSITSSSTGYTCLSCSMAQDHRPPGQRKPNRESLTKKQKIYTPLHIAEMHTNEIFMLTITVPGVGESTPPLSFLDAIRFRFEYAGITQEIVGTIMDIKIATEEVTVRLPSPMIADTVTFGFMPMVTYKASTRPAEVQFQDLSLVPYYRFLLYGLGICSLEFPGVVNGQKELGVMRYDDVFSSAQFLETVTRPTTVLPFQKRCEIPRFSVNFGLGQMKGLRICGIVLDEAIKVGPCEENNFNLERVMAPRKRPDDGVKALPRDSCDRDWNYFHDNLNREQRNAIYDIFYNLHGPIPYILFGPPGTGKTLTFVESILQLLLYPNPVDSRVKILVCAPSDAACDVIAMRLLPHLKKSSTKTHIIRLNHFQRKSSYLPPSLLSSSPMNDNGMFKIPPTLDQIPLLNRPSTPTIIISTCFSSSLLPKNDLPFTHLFVDEAAQATEAEVFIPILHVGKGCNVAIGGDPRQLGPSIFNNHAGREGLALSLLERLMALNIYTEGKYAIITKLKNNYRSHKALLDIPSALFYDNELESFAEKETADSALKWEGLEGAKSDFPMLFYDARKGEQMNEVDNPSLFNYHECEVVRDFIMQLLKSDNVNVSTKDLAVITPFRAQVLQMRKVLRAAKLSAVSVGQVEDYQGQEQKIVIISCVQTERSKLGKGGDGTGGQGYGFVEDPKRFNVAVSRAKSLNIIVGNINYLNSTGTYWEAMIAHCKANFAVSGDEESELCADLGGFAGHYSGVDELTSYVERIGLGAACEDDKLEQALRGYYNGGDSWRVQL